MSEHLIGLLLGTEEDWPAAFEALVARLGPVDGHELRTERIVNEPFDLRAPARYALIIDRLAWWYDLPRAYLKKVSMMDDVYLLNNPFTFQSMEKHSAYCALMRLGIRVPETWLIPHKVPPANPRFQPTAERYNAAFDLEEIAERVGYPLFMKPFDGGQWVGVSRVGSPQELHARYDESGERLMHLQTALEGFDVFVRSLSIGAETMSMWFDPSKPMHDRYQVRHDFLTPELGEEIITISRLVNAFFRWEFNSCETIVKDGVAYPIDYANASPDVALTSLHYYFPWAITALVRWSAFCAVTRREMRINQNSRDYFEWGDRERSLLRGEADALPRAGRRLLPGRRLRRVLRPAPRAPRRRRPRLVHVGGVRRRARADRALDVPGARAGAVRRALPRADRRLGAGRGGESLTPSRAAAGVPLAG